MAETFAEKGVVILGISFDTIEANRAFAEKFDFPYQLLCDTDRKIGLAYGACDSLDASAPRRITYLIDPEGRIKKTWPKVDPRASVHAQDVLDAL